MINSINFAHAANVAHAVCARSCRKTRCLHPRQFIDLAAKGLSQAPVPLEYAGGFGFRRATGVARRGCGSAGGAAWAQPFHGDGSRGARQRGGQAIPPGMVISDCQRSLEMPRVWECRALTERCACGARMRRSHPGCSEALAAATCLSRCCRRVQTKTTVRAGHNALAVLPPALTGLPRCRAQRSLRWQQRRPRWRCGRGAHGPARRRPSM